MTGDMIGNIWLAVGFVGEAIFGGRFVIQWLATERAKRSVIPVSFWHLSVIGSLVLLVYSFYRWDPVFILGNSVNLLIYLRNMYFIYRKPPVEPVQAPAAPAAQRPPGDKAGPDAG